MNNRLLVTALGTAAMAVTGCAYQGSSYGHNAYPTYTAHTNYQPHSYKTATRGQTRLEFDIAAEQFIDGNLIDGAGAIQDVSYNDAFKTGYRVSGGVARDFRPNTTVTAKGFYKQADGEDSFVLATGGGMTIDGSVSDFKSYGGELGLRQYLSPNRGRQLRPFVGASVGASYIEDIELTSGGITDVLNESGWVATAAATGGFEMPVSATTSLSLESGIRWEGAQDRSGLGAASFGDDNSRLSVPVTLRGRFRF